MRTPEPLRVIGVDEAWSELRHHLDWTVDQGTVVLVAAQSRDQLEDMRARARMWAARAHTSWNEAPQGDDVSEWLYRSFPTPGVLWIDVWDDARRIVALHRLNELRVRIAQHGTGCVIIGGPTELFADAVREAVDLWSIRSLTLTIASRAVGSSEVTDATALDAEAPVLAGTGSQSAWRITLPPDLRSDEAARVLREVEGDRRLLVSDPIAARRLLKNYNWGQSKVGEVLFGLVRAEIAGMLGDGAAVEVILAACIENAKEMPDAFVVQVIEAVWQIGVAFGALDSAGLAADYLVDRGRELAGALGAPEARGDLVTALNSVGRVAEARGEWEAAGQAFREALEISRGLAGESGTPQARRDLSVSLDDVGRLAEARGDLAAAGEAYAESLVIRLFRFEGVVVG